MSVLITTQIISLENQEPESLLELILKNKFLRNKKPNQTLNNILNFMEKISFWNIKFCQFTNQIS